MKSKAVLGSLTGLLALIALADLALWSAGWDGALSERSLKAGDSITMESGLTFTLPAGREGYYTKYLWVPSCLLDCLEP